MDKEKFRALAVDLKKIIAAAEAVLEKHEVDKSVWITLGDDGFVSIVIHGENFQIVRGTSSSDMMMESNYKEVI